MSRSNLTKYCACHAKWPPKIWQKFCENNWNVICNERPIWEWSENEPVSPRPAAQPRLLFALMTSIFVLKNIKFCAPAIFPNFTLDWPRGQKTPERGWMEGSFFRFFLAIFATFSSQKNCLTQPFRSEVAAGDFFRTGCSQDFSVWSVKKGVPIVHRKLLPIGVKKSIFYPKNHPETEERLPCWLRLRHIFQRFFWWIRIIKWIVKTR